MTHWFKLLFLFLPCTLMAQHFIAYEISGTVKNFTSGQKVYFMHRGNRKGYIDSVALTDGRFVFKGQTTLSYEPEENYTDVAALLYIDHSGKGIDFKKFTVRNFPDSKTVYLEPGLTVVRMTDSARTALIIPPSQNDGHYTLDSIYTAYFVKTNQAVAAAKAQNLHSGEFMRFLEKRRQIYQAEQKADFWHFVKNHLSSPTSLYVLKHNEDYYPDYDRIAPYFDALSAELKATAFGKELAELLNGLKRTRIGYSAPDFTMTDQHGKPLTLSSLKGKYVLVDFWASWCGPCRQENPNVVKAYNKYKDKNFIILGVSLDQKEDAWLKAIQDDQLDWLQVSDLKYWNNAAANLYAVKAIPQNFLIDPQGNTIAKNLFGDQLTEKLAKLLDTDALVKQ